MVLSILSGYGQTHSSRSVIDDAYIKSTLCDMDTSVNFYSNVKLNWIDSTGHSSMYNFLEGNETYCEVSIRTKECTCHDCSFNRITIIQFNSLDSSHIVELTPINTICLVRNIMVYDPFITNFSGTLNFNNHTLEFYPTIDQDRNVVFEGKIIKNILLTKPKLH